MGELRILRDPCPACAPLVRAQASELRRLSAENARLVQQLTERNQRVTHLELALVDVGETVNECRRLVGVRT